MSPANKFFKEYVPLPDTILVFYRCVTYQEAFPSVTFLPIAARPPCSAVTRSDVFTILQEIQRTWSYLEPLFIGSEEVKKELPEDAKRFEIIDTDVKGLLISVSCSPALSA